MLTYCVQKQLAADFTLRIDPGLLVMIRLDIFFFVINREGVFREDGDGGGF